jgi:hypothetical protein
MKKVIRTNKAAIKQAIDLLHANANKILVWYAPRKRFFTSTTNVGAEVFSTARNLTARNINDLKFQDRFGNPVEFEINS